MSRILAFFFGSIVGWGGFILGGRRNFIRPLNGSRRTLLTTADDGKGKGLKIERIAALNSFVLTSV
jgi:hypothetical protein